MKIEPEEWFSQMDWQDFSGRAILGIDGFSRTGKTKLSKELEAHLREQGLAVLVFHIDDFIVEKKRRYWKAEAYYEEMLKPAEQADWVLDSSTSKIGDAT